MSCEAKDILLDIIRWAAGPDGGAVVVEAEGLAEVTTLLGMVGEGAKEREALEYIRDHYGVCPIGGCGQLEREHRCVACIAAEGLS